MGEFNLLTIIPCFFLATLGPFLSTFDVSDHYFFEGLFLV